jgi:hypothetical protein
MEDLGVQGDSNICPRFSTGNYHLSKISFMEQMKTKFFWDIFLPVTGHGFTINDETKQNNSSHTGRVLLHLTPRKHNRCSPSAACVFLLCKGTNLKGIILIKL